MIDFAVDVSLMVSMLRIPLIQYVGHMRNIIFVRLCNTSLITQFILVRATGSISISFHFIVSTDKVREVFDYITCRRFVWHVIIFVSGSIGVVVVFFSVSWSSCHSLFHIIRFDPCLYLLYCMNLKGALFTWFCWYCYRLFCHNIRFEP